MPEIVLYSRRWHATTDTLPFPLGFGAMFHAVFLIVYGALIGRFDVWNTCPGQGAHYIAVTGSLMTIIFCELVLELAMIYVGLKGAHRSDPDAPGGSNCDRDLETCSISPCA